MFKSRRRARPVRGAQGYRTYQRMCRCVTEEVGSVPAVEEGPDCGARLRLPRNGIKARSEPRVVATRNRVEPHDGGPTATLPNGRFRDAILVQRRIPTAAVDHRPIFHDIEG